MDFTIIDRAGITQGQFATLIGVGRVTVNTWVNGRFKPRGKTRDLVLRLVRLLQEALDAGALPVKVVDRREATDTALKEIGTRLHTGKE